MSSADGEWGLDVVMHYGLGIDLGTTQTVAAIWIDGRAQVVPLGGRTAGIPSLIFVKPDGGLLFGEAAEHRGQIEAARQIKHGIGDPVPVVAGGTVFMAHTLVAKILRYVLDTVTNMQHGPPTSTTVTYPAYWGASECAQLRRAIELAGIGPVQLCTAPEAVALHAATLRRIPTGATVAVYYLGGGTFEAAVLRRENDGFVLLNEPDGTVRVGGSDFDEVVFQHVLGLLGDAAKGLNLGDSALARLREACIQAKEALSFDTEVEIPVALPGLNTRVRLHRRELESMIADLLDETIAAMRQALHSAGVTSEDELAGVLLAGGSSQIPLVARLLSERLLLAPIADPNPELSVALGAAAATRTMANQGKLDDDVQFTVYRPARLRTGVWQSILFFAHKSDPIVDPARGVTDPLIEVEERAAAHFRGEDVRANTADARGSVPHGASLRVALDLPGVRCDPSTAEIVWRRPVHEAHFRVRADAQLAGTVIRGWVRVWCGLLLIGEVRVAIEVASSTALPAPSDLIAEPVTRYRKIFPSYSHQDKAIVAQFAMVAHALGDQYLQDVLVLRSGEDWDARLLKLIEEADVFQLFWSSNSMRSPHCRREWENALALRRSMFVRPVYWEDPLPAAPELDLPSAALRTLHFTKIPRTLSPPPAGRPGPPASYGPHPGFGTINPGIGLSPAVPLAVAAIVLVLLILVWLFLA